MKCNNYMLRCDVSILCSGSSSIVDCLRCRRCCCSSSPSCWPLSRRPSTPTVSSPTVFFLLLLVIITIIIIMTALKDGGWRASFYIPNRARLYTSVINTKTLLLLFCCFAGCQLGHGRHLDVHRYNVYIKLL